MTATGRQLGHREPQSSGPEGSEAAPPPDQRQGEASAKEARTEAIIRSALDCVVIMDHHGLIREFNPAAEEVFGYSRDEVLGRPLVETIVPPALRERHRMGLAHHLATGETRVIGRRVEMIAMRKDGSEFPVELSISRIEAPGPPMFTGFIRDISRRMQRQAAVKRLAAIVESTTDAILGKTLDGIITDWNRGAEVMYGYSPQEILGRHVSVLVPEERRRELDRIMDRMALGERVEHIETVRLRKDGTRIQVAVSISPIRADDGSILGASSIARDITGRTRLDRERADLLRAERIARAQAEGARERLAFLAEASTVLSGSLDYNATLHRLADLAVSRLADWCLIEMIDAGSRLSAVAMAHRDPVLLDRVRALTEQVPFDPDRALGPANVVRTGRPELYAEVTDELLANVLKDPKEATAIREMGVRSAMIVPLSARGRTMGAMTFASTTGDRLFGPEDLALAEELARHAGLAIDNARLYRDAERMTTELEHRVAERTAELEASNRELEAFSYSVSHDLRAPLRAIDGFSRILLKDYGTQVPDQAREYLEIVREGAQQMGRLIDDLLAFARLGRQSLTMQTVDPASIAHRVLDHLRHDLEGRDVEVRVGELPPCQGDPALLQQVYVNLLANALKFTRTRSPAVIEVGATVRDDRPVYFVKDNGVGFDMRFADKLFGVFQRMHRAEDYEGTGVGLAIVQRVVHRHGGRVWAEAEPDVGATFFFTVEGSVGHNAPDDG